MLKSIPRTRLGEINWGVWLRSWHLMWTCSYSSVTARMIRVFIYIYICIYIYRTLCVRQNLYVHMQIAANIFVFFAFAWFEGCNLEWDMEPVYKYHFNLDPKAISTVWLIQQMFPKSCILSAGMWIQAAPERAWNSGCIYIYIYSREPKLRMTFWKINHTV